MRGLPARAASRVRAEELSRCPTIGCARPLALPVPDVPAAPPEGETRGLEVSVSKLAVGEAAFEFFAVADPEQAVQAALGCTGILAVIGLGTLGLYGHTGSSGYLYPTVICALLAAGALVHGLHGWLATRQLRIRFLEAPRRAWPGESFRVALEVEALRPTSIDVLRVVLGCVERTTTRSPAKDRSEGEWEWVVEHRVLFHQDHVVEAALSLMGGEQRRVEVELRLPADAPPTRSEAGPSDARREVLWVLGVHADVRRWPDYQRTRSLVVAHGEGRSPEPAGRPAPRTEGHPKA